MYITWGKFIFLNFLILLPLLVLLSMLLLLLLNCCWWSLFRSLWWMCPRTPSHTALCIALLALLFHAIWWAPAAQTRQVSVCYGYIGSNWIWARSQWLNHPSHSKVLAPCAAPNFAMWFIVPCIDTHLRLLLFAQYMCNSATYYWHITPLAWDALFRCCSFFSV